MTSVNRDILNVDRVDTRVASIIMQGHESFVFNLAFGQTIEARSNGYAELYPVESYVCDKVLPLWNGDGDIRSYNFNMIKHEVYRSIVERLE